MKTASRNVCKVEITRSELARALTRTAEFVRMLVTVFVLGCVTAVYVNPCEATPFTDHFDNLIADLQNEAATLGNSTDKTQQKQFKAIQKVLGTLEGKNSMSLGTDIKNLGSVAKTLAKAFPDDFTSPDGSFSTDLETALQGLIDDVQAILDAAQTAVDDLGDSPCATKAQGALDAASNQIAAASAATDFAVASKLLGAALKSAQKANVAAEKCISGSGRGAGSGDFMKATISGDFTLNFSATEQGTVFAILDSGADMVGFNGAVLSLGGVDIAFWVSDVTGPGTYPLLLESAVSRINPSATYTLDSGTITFTTYDLANQKLTGTFSFTASTDSGTVSVSSGSFRISKIISN